jgi:hypothetical protein
VSMGPLGRRVPTDFEHVERYPLTVTTTPVGPTPVVIGVNWYENFDVPVRDSSGRWWIGRGDLGRVRGGHCVALAPGKLADLTAWWEFYDQGREGACVGFGSSRMMSLLNRKRYDARWLWNRAKQVDEWPDTNPGDDNGTSVRAALDILRTEGHKPWQGVGRVKPAEGISANRWARSVDEVHQVLQNGVADRLGAVPPLNSWGRDGYPHVVWMPDETLDRLIQEDGEIGLVTDR